MMKVAAGGARGDTSSRGRKKARVFIVTLSRRWWRGGALLLALLVGGWLALILEPSQDGRPAAPVTVDTVAESERSALAPADRPDAPSTASQDRETAAGAVAVQASAVRFHPFDELRLERDRQRSRQAELLQSTAQDASVGEQRRREAHEQLLALWTLEAREVELEQLLQAQGYTSVVALSPHGAHVVVDGLLDASAAARIGELVHRVAGVPREGITIVDGIISGR